MSAETAGRKRNGSLILEMCLAIALASIFLIAYQGVIRQLYHIDARTSEKHALTSSAIALGRAIADRPELVTQPRELEVELRRLNGTLRGEKVEVERRPTEQL